MGPVQKLVCSTLKSQQGPDYACVCSIRFFRTLLDFSCHLEHMLYMHALKECLRVLPIPPSFVQLSQPVCLKYYSLFE